MQFCASGAGDRGCAVFFSNIFGAILRVQCSSKNGWSFCIRNSLPSILQLILLCIGWPCDCKNNERIFMFSSSICWKEMWCTSVGRRIGLRLVLGCGLLLRVTLFTCDFFYTKQQDRNKVHFDICRGSFALISAVPSHS